MTSCINNSFHLFLGNLASQKPPAKCKGLLSCLLTVTPEADFDTDSEYRRVSVQISVLFVVCFSFMVSYLLTRTQFGLCFPFQ